MKKRLSILFIAILALVLSGCGQTVSPEKVPIEKAQTTNQPQEQQQAQDSETPKAPSTYKIGEKVKMGELAITVNSVKRTKGGEFIKAESGKTFLLVDATIENLGKEPAAISSIMMFKMTDSDAYNYNITMGPEDSKGSLDGEIAPTRKMRGELAFEVPEKSKGLELIFEPNLLGFGQAIFEVK